MKGSVKYYFGSTPYLIIICFFVLYIWLNKKESLNKRILISLACFCLALFCEFALFKKIGYQSYVYRSYWLLPLSLAISLGMTWIWTKLNLIKRVTFVVLTYIMIFSLGNDITYYDMPENIYQLDQDVIDIADKIINDSNEEYITVIGQRYFMQQCRLYSSHFIWGYSDRAVMMNADKHITENTDSASTRLAEAIQNNYFPDEMDIISDLKVLNVDYLVVYKDNLFLEQLVSDCYEVIGENEKFVAIKIHY